ncbi:Detected protein of unknown function [Hibiscus syriacus]|uniref:Uncharacterized protein n=1 Tax=Hibiscus syriacus TaxID=106335 RepID=A0A6A2XLI8_HIBSY|nr:Detected protein of unknown function [Hibiscus syriacus]
MRSLLDFNLLRLLYSSSTTDVNPKRAEKFESSIVRGEEDEYPINADLLKLGGAVSLLRIILRLPDDSEVSDELWDEVIELMKFRVVDKVPLTCTLAVRALSRFVNDSENTDILDVFLEVLPLEQNSEVRKTIVLSLPPSNTTSQLIIDCTMDVSEPVRKAAYCVIANKFPLQSLSIKHRTTILQRGLADRSLAVSKECLKLMIDQWLAKCSNGDPVKLLKYLDVETYESVGESIMESLLKAGLVKPQNLESIQQYILRASTNEIKEGYSVDHSVRIKLMEPEVSLYWRMGKGSDAAATMGTEELYTLLKPQTTMIC